MEAVSMISTLMIPLIIVIILVYAMLKKKDSYALFVEGGKEALAIVASIIPFMVGMIVAIAIFQASGLLDVLINIFSPIFSWLKIPTEIVPVALVRPISGHAALGMTNELLKTFGADSIIGRLASAIHASSDTTFYVLTVYFGSVGIKKAGDAVKIALVGDLIGITAAIFLVLYFFS